MKIKCKSSEQASQVLDTIIAYLRRSRFELMNRPCVKGKWIDLGSIRLRKAKEYCGNHPGPCLVLLPKKHRKGKWLEGLDWVAFNDMLNDALDSIQFDGNVGTATCNIRKGKERRTSYREATNTFGGVDWQKFGDYCDYLDCTDGQVVASEYPEGTPGIATWQVTGDVR